MFFSLNPSKGNGFHLSYVHDKAPCTKPQPIISDRQHRCFIGNEEVSGNTPRLRMFELALSSSILRLIPPAHQFSRTTMKEQFDAVLLEIEFNKDFLIYFPLPTLLETWLDVRDVIGSYTEYWTYQYKFTINYANS